MNKTKNTHLIIYIFILTSFFLGNLAIVSLHGASGIYDRIGIIPEHGLHGAVPEENIDLFTGNLTLRFQDIRLPGPNGFDTVVWRVYNSKILRDRLPASAWDIQQDPYSWVGMGWSMHMGIVHNYITSEPVIEFPDGRFETAYPNNSDSYYYTRDFLRYDKTNFKLYFKDGTVWTFGLDKTIIINGVSEVVRVVTQITNSYGHTITVTYQSGSKPQLETITDSLGRTINFEISNNRLSRIAVKNTTGTTVYYNYTVETFPYGGYYKLSKYAPPVISASTYEYYTGQYDRYELTAVNTAYGGRMEYSYLNDTFYFNIQPLETRVVTQKKIRFSSSGSFYTWNYTYPDYRNTESGTVVVTGPVYNTNVTYYAYSAAAPWRIGLMSKKWFSDNSYFEETQWTYREISYNIWYVLNINMGTIKAPLIQKSIISRYGDAESTEEYLYEREAVKKYGFPTRINYYGGINGTTLMNYKTLSYNFETDSNYAGKYLLSYVKYENLYSSSGSKLKQTETTYYSTSGKYGAIDMIKRWKEGSTYLTWDYTYTSSNPNSITITIDLPGSSGIETYVYSYGVLSQLKRPGYTELTRTISSHTSDITSETNQHGSVMNFSYDNLGRITNIGMPTEFNNITATWYSNSVSIVQGSNTATKYWDGLARDTGFQESGDGTTLHFRKTLDAEGRVTEESKGGSSASYIYRYQLNAAGNPMFITDPNGKMTTISYQDDYKTVTDAEAHAAVFYYYGFPGLTTQLKDALAKTANYTYDGAGRLTQVTFNNARTQSYAYNGLDQVTSEVHPETGSISYTYDAQGNLSTKTWGGVTYSYSYNTSNQLTQSNSGDETITYTYDTSGRVSAVSSSKSWKRDIITYNKLGSITGERQTIPGISVKSSAYGYDKNNNLSSITYPDGKIENITNNGLNMPETILFNSKKLVSASAYGSLKQPTAMTISGNGTAFSASYNNNGALASALLKKGTATYYSATYGYDKVGNIKSLTGTVPALNATFGYDPLYRLTSAVYTGGKSYAYTYDNYGNLTSAKENNIAVFNAAYNAKNQPNTTGFVFDSRGNMTGSPLTPGYSYIWSNDNYLKTVKNGTGTSIAANDYNERGLRFHVRRAILQAIDLIYPNGGQSYQIGTTLPITWKSQGVGNVKIEYTTNNGSSWTSINASTANSGIYKWVIPNTPSSMCRVRVSDIDGFPFDQSDTIFTIPSPTIKVVTPNGGEGLQMGSLYNITWSGADVVDNVKIDYSTDNGSTWIGIISSTENSGSFKWKVPNTLSSTCRVRVSTLDDSLSDVSNAAFSIIENPMIEVTFPNGGEKLEAGSHQVITWNRIETDSGRDAADAASVTAVTIEYSIDNGLNWIVIEPSYQTYQTYQSNVSDSGNKKSPVSESYTWTVPDNVSDSCRVRISKNRRGEFDSHVVDISDISDDVFSISTPSALNIISPNGGEVIEPGKNFTIRWITGTALDIENVRLEYSPDNGTTYFPIAGYIPNTESYEWLVPHHLSKHCLVRISRAADKDDKDEKLPEFNLHYEFKFRVEEIENDFIIQLGDTKNEMIKYSIPSFTFHHEFNGNNSKMYLSFAERFVELSNYEDFLHSLHVFKIVLNNTKETVSVVLDGKTVLEDIPLSSLYHFSPAISFISGVGTEVSIDDLCVKIHSSQENENEWNVLFNEDFERFSDGEREQLKAEGWIQLLAEIKEKTVDSVGETDNISIISFDKDFFNTGQVLRIKPDGGRKTGVVKFFQLPVNFPFDVSDKPFEIKYNNDMDNAISPISTGNDRQESYIYTDDPGYKAHGPYFTPDAGGQIQAVTINYIDTYYIYSFDGKLLSEYDQSGTCVRDYIYAGNRLIAEYLPQTSKYYYYMSDQINSTRIITDDSGNIVYSEAYGPYGDFQKTWTKTYDPKQKFSGKEREEYSELDYFGARYFDNNSYRFISVDPIINKEEALSNPQLWNLYAYCANNPITHFDPDGRKVWLGARSLDYPIVGSLGVHTYILIMPNNPEDFGGKTKWAISGYREKGQLKLDLNNLHDRNLKSSERKGLYEITPPDGKSDSEFIKDILNTTKSYKNLSRKFDRYPNIANNEGNCNSLSTSILVGAGVSIEEIKKVDPPGFNWGLGEVFPEMVNKKGN